MNKKTKIVASAAATIAMCASLAVGGTFALFTSESKVNVTVSSGKVKVVANANNLTLHSPTSIGLNGVVVDDTNAASATAFKNGGTASITDGNVVELYEMTPGDSASFDIVVTNESSVTVQYQTKLETLEGIDLFSGLRIKLKKGENSEYAYDGMTAYSQWATLTEQGEVETTKVTIELPADAGNQYQNLTCKLAFTVTAVQGNTKVTQPEENVTYLYNANDLRLFEKSVNNGVSYAGKTVKLMNDIDLGGMNWMPIGRMIDTNGVGENSTFTGTFDGNNFTVSNYKIDTVEGIEGNDTNKGAGLFGAVHGDIVNLKVKNVEIKTAHWAGAIAGGIQGNIDNCSAENVTITCLPELIGSEWDNGDKAGAIVGYVSSYTGETSSITNCTVKTVNITGYRDLGGIAGYSASDIKDCTVDNATIICDPTHNYKHYTEFDAFDCEKLVGEGSYDAVTCIATNTVAKFIKDGMVFTAEQLASALTANEANIKVVLANDIELDISSLGTQIPGSGQYRLGGADTQVIDIDLNGYSFTLGTTYMSALGAVNSSATATIKNGTMTSSSASGTWNIYDIMFTDCNWVLNGVTFEKSVAINNVGSTVTMKNVTINEVNDFYAIWICSGADVTMDGCMVNSAGRAIKISDQYVAKAERKLTNLTVKNTTFKSVKKAAILVGSTKGANITLDNVDISGVRGDSTYAVWVDNGTQTETGETYANYADSVTVTGGSKKIEP